MLDTKLLKEKSITKLEVYRCDFLNIRKGPSTKYGIISRIYPGYVVEVVKRQGNWARIKFNGGYAWCSLLYLKTISNSSSTSQVSVYKVLVAINLRDRASWNANKLVVANKGTLLDVLSIEGDWAKVWYNNREMYAPVTNGKVIYIQDTGVVKPGGNGEVEEETPIPPLTEEKEIIRPTMNFKNEFWIDIYNPDMPKFSFNTSILNMHMITKPIEVISMLKSEKIDNLSWDGNLSSTMNTFDTSEIELEFYVRGENYNYILKQLKEISKMPSFRLTLGWNRRFFRYARLADNIEIEEYPHDDIEAKITLVFELQPYNYAQEGVYYTKDINTGKTFLKHGSSIMNNYEVSYPKLIVPIPHKNLCETNADNEKVVTICFYSYHTETYYYYSLYAHEEAGADYIYAVIDSTTGNVYEDTTDRNLNYLYKIENEFPMLYPGKTLISQSTSYVDKDKNFLEFKIIPNWREL